MRELPMPWLKRLECALEVATEIPMWGFGPEFPVKAFEKALGQALHLDDLGVSLGKAEWKKEGEFLKGVSDDPMIAGITLSPLESPLTLIIPKEDAEKLSRWALDPQKKGKGFTSPEMRQGFYRFLLLQLLKIADDCHAFEDLTPKLTETSLPDGNAYAIDLSLEHKDQTIWARLLCPTSFHSEYKTHFISHPPEHTFKESSMPVTVSFEAGGVDLSLAEWEKVKAGDCIFLDRCTYRAEEHAGTFLLTLNTFPLYQVKMKKEGIKVLDYAEYFEDNTMDEQPDEIENLPDVEETIKDESKTTNVISTKEIPLSVTVEVARVTMSLKKLLALKPGNMLDLSIMPEQGVNLTVNGKVVGRGQLLQIGESLGVQVMEVAE